MLTSTASTSSLIQLKINMASRLCYDMSACSCQIWGLFNVVFQFLQDHVAIASHLLMKDRFVMLRERFKSLIHVIPCVLEDIDGHVRKMNMLHSRIRIQKRRIELLSLQCVGIPHFRRCDENR